MQTKAARACASLALVALLLSAGCSYPGGPLDAVTAAAALRGAPPDGAPAWVPPADAPHPAAPPSAPHLLASAGTLRLWEDDQGLILGPLTDPYPSFQLRQDGRYLALLGAQPWQEPHAYLLDVEQRTLRELSVPSSPGPLRSAPTTQLNWLADGRLLWAAVGEGDSVFFEAESVTTGERTELYRGPDLVLPTADLSGPEPVFVEMNGYALVRLEDGRPVPLVPGEHLVVAHYPGGNLPQWPLVATTLVDFTGTHWFDQRQGVLRPLAPAGQTIWGAAPSPDGSRVAVISRSPEGAGEFAVVDTATGARTVLPDGGHALQRVVWLDNQTVAATSESNPPFKGTWVVRLSDGVGRFTPLPLFPVAAAGTGTLFGQLDPAYKPSAAVAVQGRFVTEATTERWLVRQDDGGAAELLAARADPVPLPGGGMLVAVHDRANAEVYLLGPEGGLQPLSGPLRPGARATAPGGQAAAAAGGMLAYLYQGYEAKYLRVRPLTPLPSAPGLAPYAVQGPMPDLPPAAEPVANVEVDGLVRSYLDQMPEDGTFRRLAAGVSPGPLDQAPFAGGRYLAVAASAAEFAPIMRLAEQVSGVPVAMPAVQWGDEVAVAVFRGPGDGAVTVRRAKEYDLWVDWPGPGDRWSYDIVAMPRTGGWDYVSYRAWTGSTDAPRLVGGASALLPPSAGWQSPAEGQAPAPGQAPAGGLPQQQPRPASWPRFPEHVYLGPGTPQNPTLLPPWSREGGSEALARAYQDAAKVVADYLHARASGDQGAAEALLAFPSRFPGPMPEHVLALPPGSRLDTLLIAAAPRVPQGEAISIEVQFELDSGEAWPPAPWVRGRNEAYFTLVREGGKWRLLFTQ